MTSDQAGIVVAATWLHWANQELLAVRPHGSEAYLLPGGIPEAGESLPKAVARKVLEEVGMVVLPDDLKQVVRVEDQAYGRPGVTVQLICFEGPGTGEPCAGADEIAEVRWLGPADWHRFAPAVQKALREIDGTRPTDCH
ncbi:MAG: NUDIX domain-containing protein [Candidatus Nanopelagicales bacterium]